MSKYSKKEYYMKPKEYYMEPLVEMSENDYQKLKHTPVSKRIRDNFVLDLNGYKVNYKNLPEDPVMDQRYFDMDFLTMFIFKNNTWVPYKGGYWIKKENEQVQFYNKNWDEWVTLTLKNFHSFEEVLVPVFNNKPELIVDFLEKINVDVIPFPDNPIIGQVFRFDDCFLTFIYDGSKWICTHCSSSLLSQYLYFLCKIQIERDQFIIEEFIDMLDDFDPDTNIKKQVLEFLQIGNVPKLPKRKFMVSKRDPLKIDKNWKECSEYENVSENKPSMMDMACSSIGLVAGAAMVTGAGKSLLKAVGNSGFKKIKE